MQSKTATDSRVGVMLVTLFGVLLVAPALGQEPVKPEETIIEPETNVPIESIDNAADPATANPSGVILEIEPTESIPEDDPVSFPVDI